MAIGSAALGRESEEIAILDVDEASGHFGAFEGPADAQEIPAFVMRERGVGDAMETMTSENDAATETMWTGGGFFLRIEAAKSQIEAVQVFPHFARDAVANGAGILARFGDALHDGTRVVGIEGEKFEDIVGFRFGIKLAEESLFASHGENGIPAHAVRLLDLLEQRVEGDVENAGGVFGATDIASQPEKGIGDAGEHVSTLPGEPKCLCCRRLGKN